MGATPTDTERAADRARIADALQRARDGDQGGWDALVGRYEAMVWAILRAQAISRPDAEEVFQTVWLRLVEHLDAIRDPAALGGWLAITTKREAWRRNQRSMRQRPTEAVHLERADPTVEDAADALIASEEQRAVRAAFTQLTERCRTLLGLLSTDPPTAYETIVEVTGMAVGSIGPTRRRCLTALQRLLALPRPPARRPWPTARRPTTRRRGAS